MTISKTNVGNVKTIENSEAEQTTLSEQMLTNTLNKILEDNVTDSTNSEDENVCTYKGCCKVAYEDGYEEGREVGEDAGFDAGFSEARDEWYSEWYNAGLTDAIRKFTNAITDSDYEKPGGRFRFQCLLRSLIGMYKD